MFFISRKNSPNILLLFSPFFFLSLLLLQCPLHCCSTARFLKQRSVLFFFLPIIVFIDFCSKGNWTGLVFFCSSLWKYSSLNFQKILSSSAWVLKPFYFKTVAVVVVAVEAAAGTFLLDRLPLYVRLLNIRFFVDFHAHTHTHTPPMFCCRALSPFSMFRCYRLSLCLRCFVVVRPSVRARLLSPGCVNLLLEK